MLLRLFVRYPPWRSGRRGDPYPIRAKRIRGAIPKIMAARRLLCALFHNTPAVTIFYCAVPIAAVAEPSTVLTGKAATGDWTSDTPDVMRKITVQDLPPPGSNALAINRAHVVDRP